ncbi:ribonuclease J [Vreelandella venusta]|uniref:ribonuclease J n=1 Tax=Vreelandella venusta TaxID=44935 RepID=UPI00200DD59A|nr:ribonuclease J [Halomonas venusta]MBR9926951.1 ribonuclease J [Gammaproteobacteria bacterium]MDX1714828.1 ribonuclease J [Halomonas venusta]UQI42814.1 ribonuclease J [Halomonas venusta]
MNLTLYGYDDEWIAVDCGMMIRQDLPNSPLQVPNTDTLAALNITPKALYITHGHEDHIGAVAWLWPRWNCPIFATPLAAGLLRHKFAEHQLSSAAIHVVESGDAMELGPFTLRYLQVTHSIPESCSILMQAGDYRVLHTGDWKLDPNPLIGSPINAAQFRALAPIDLVVGDSTNAPMPGHSGSEGDVAKALAHTLKQCTGRVVVSCFASNLARVLAIGVAAQQCGRRVSLMGRSMERMVSVAKGLGYLDDFPPLVPPHDLGYLPPEEVVIIATGSQGEPRAALQRLAQRRHPFVDLEPGDSIIFSAKAIPGNERPIEQLKKRLAQLGVSIFDEMNHPELHATGHPAEDELRKLYQWVRPKTLLPVHGEARHQAAHQEIATSLGILAPLAPVNGDMLMFDNLGLRCEARYPQPPCIVNQNSVVPHPGLDTGIHSSRRGSLFLALPVTATDTGWCRIGRLMLDASATSPLDEDSFSEWLDDQLQEIAAETLADLRQALQPRLIHWLANHLQHMPDVHLQIMATEMPYSETMNSD